MSIYAITQDYIPTTLNLHSNSVSTPLINVVDISNNILYSLPTVQPSVPSILEVFPNGSSDWISAGSLVPIDAIINSEPTITPDNGSLLISTGSNPFSSIFTPYIKIDSNDNNTVNTYSDIRLHNTIENPNFSSIAMSEDDTLNLVNYNTDGDIIFSTNQYTRSFSEIVNELINLRSEVDSLKLVIKNLTDIDI
jgi:hypothetical protein